MKSIFSKYSFAGFSFTNAEYRRTVARLRDLANACLAGKYLYSVCEKFSGFQPSKLNLLSSNVELGVIYPLSIAGPYTRCGLIVEPGER